MQRPAATIISHVEGAGLETEAHLLSHEPHANAVTYAPQLGGGQKRHTQPRSIYEGQSLPVRNPGPIGLTPPTPRTHCALRF
ncbi:hypothetical protein AAFF_G00107070 [Aldrovandia affinis]|uniref:Uncharacterized protein n=1 Tax=Aldrovandia affinis TaxID=143900 RepID=A0AAD7T2Q9_9TELE|nr:hypothetical protein AAFF_G00107070 [Aldrovandia affinis]